MPGPAQGTGGPGDRDGRAEGPGPPAQAALDGLGPAGAVGVRHQQARVLPGHVDQDVRRQRGQRAEMLLAPVFQGHHRDPARQGPPGRTGKIRDRLPRHRRIGDDQVEQPAAAPLQLACGLRAGLGETFRAGGGELVQVQEQGLTHRSDRVDAQAAADRLLTQHPPGDPGPEPQRRLERLQAAALGRLDPADVPEQLRGRLARGPRVGDLQDELPDGLVHGAAHRAGVDVVVRPRVFGHVPLDRDDHFFRRAPQFRPHDVGDLGRHGGPRGRSRERRAVREFCAVRLPHASSPALLTRTYTTRAARSSGHGEAAGHPFVRSGQKSGPAD